jgi:hypothetical protein
VKEVMDVFIIQALIVKERKIQKKQSQKFKKLIFIVKMKKVLDFI